jgi:hypothetical protein
MSQTAIFSGMYEELRDYAELLDKTLAELKGQAYLPQNERRQQLGQFLRELGQAQSRSLAVRLLGRILRREGAVAPQELARIGGRLAGAEAVKVDPGMVAQLEQLARSLEQEQATALARMRGQDL